ncbi:MAG: TlyA family RNA methyltransferase [Candidatus Chromulinivorax sp.]|nr:TlyA family RNA methyltransferase [Candidatus Chromulinivorax sp.]
MELLKKTDTHKRLDVVIHERRPDLSRSLIQSWIQQGFVMVAGKVVTKNGMLVTPDVEFTLHLDQPEYVSRSGAKLKQALQEFSIDVAGLNAIDVGLSTGGFTDCLLQNGIGKVTGVDVGTAQVHPKISADDRVVVMEQTDIRNCLGVIEPVDFVCIDVSFISVTKIIDVVVRLLKPTGKVVILIKPQFETVKKSLARGGIVKNSVLRKQIMQDVTTAIEHAGLSLQGCVESITIGGDGNIEYLAYFVKR